MAIEPKNTREHILSLYGHISGVKKNLKHVHEDVDKLGGKIDKIYWVLLTVAGTAVCLLYTSPSPRDGLLSRMPSSA